MISVVHVIWSANFGGIETLVSSLCAEQKNNPELKVELLIAKGKIPSKRTDGQSYLVHFAELKNGFDFSFQKYKNLRSFFNQFDIIHIHSFNLLVVYAAVAAGKKIVFTEHGNFGFGRRQKLTDILNYFFLKRFLRKHVSFISFNSEFTEQVARARYKLTARNSEVIYNGICFSSVKNDSIPDEELKKKLNGKFVIGTSSRFAGFKRIDRLIKAFAEFQENKKTILLLVGDGIKRNDLEELVAQLGINHKTIFTGYRTDVRQIQQMMDVCVFPSQNEPFGLVAIEALSLGKPVIVFQDGGGIAELIKKVSYDDIVDDIHILSQRLDYYYHHQQEIQKGIEERIRFAGLFDIKVMEEKFFNIYKMLV
jgi:glycosyltransferase involved in cell wall biosynthesis